jgi:hypothetical protein
MSEIAIERNSFIGFEYRDIKVSRELEPVYADGLVSFGWILENVTALLPARTQVALRFKRDRKIRNKAELCRLQHQFESAVDEIEELENSKTTSATIVSLLAGVVGCAWMAGSVFAFITGMIPLSIILAIPGFAAWFVSYPAFKSLKKKAITRTTPLIEAKYEELYETCEKASQLL